MSKAQDKVTAKQIRKAFGDSAADWIAIIDTRSRASANILRRGFFGRLKWLLFGR